MFLLDVSLVLIFSDIEKAQMTELAFACAQHEKKTYDILVKQLGEEDSRTRDSQNWMSTFKARELQVDAVFQECYFTLLFLSF
jgi:hypothetical protein